MNYTLRLANAMVDRMTSSERAAAMRVRHVHTREGLVQQVEREKAIIIDHNLLEWSYQDLDRLKSSLSPVIPNMHPVPHSSRASILADWIYYCVSQLLVHGVDLRVLKRGEPIAYQA